MILQSLHCRVVGAHVQNEVANQPFAGVVVVAAFTVERDDLLNVHFRLGDGSGLIDADDIDSGKGLYALHVVNQRFFLCKPHNTYRKSHACQQIQPLRDHADDGCGGFFYA